MRSEMDNREQPAALVPDQPTGLIFAGMGGPDSPESVRPFLRNLFSDPAILPLPRLMASPLAGLIAAARATKVAGKYEMIWSSLKNSDQPGSQLAWTELQAAQLQKRLREADINVTAKVAMRYWRPYSSETISELVALGVSQCVIVPAYPQYSSVTSGSLFTQLQTELAQQAPGMPVVTIAEWHLLPGYLESIVSPVESVLRSWAAANYHPATCALLFVAHGLPEKLIAQGDPFLSQTQDTVTASHALLASRLTDCAAWWHALSGGASPLLAFQSRLGPVRWIGPEVKAEVKRLAAAGCKRLMIQPVSFTCEHIETLHELDIELGAHARRCGVEEYSRGAALNLDDQWLESLASHIAAEAFGVALGKHGAAAANIEDIAYGG
jgi:protoporphyrin/coproporphyrin ferrochelatase